MASVRSSLGQNNTPQVSNDYTIRFDRKIYQIAREQVRAELRGANVRIESRLDGSLAVRFQQHFFPSPNVRPHGS